MKPVRAARLQHRHEAAHGERAEAQVHGQARRGVQRRVVTVVVVARQAPGKARQQVLRARHAGMPDRHRVRHEAQVGQRGQDVVRGRRRERMGVRHRLVRAQRFRFAREAPEPGILVGREDGKRATGLRQHLVVLEDHLVLERLQAAAGAAQAVVHGPVARDRLWLVVAVGEHRFRIQPGGQFRDHLRGAPVPHDEVTSQCSQPCIQRDHTVEQKLNAAVVGWQAGQDILIEYEHGEYAARGEQGVMQCDMVVHAQIAPEPDEGVS